MAWMQAAEGAFNLLRPREKRRMKRPKRRLLKALFGLTFGFVLAADDQRRPAADDRDPAQTAEPPGEGPADHQGWRRPRPPRS